MIVIVCAWCPDNKKKTLAATKRGDDVSHTICAPCAEKLAEETK